MTSPGTAQGLFTYQTWNGMDGFWQNGVVVETLANCMHYLNNTRYRSVVTASARTLDQLLLAYGPQPSFDDMAWYGLAYTRWSAACGCHVSCVMCHVSCVMCHVSCVRVYEVTKEHKFLTIARAIFSWVWREGWDTAVCGGGVWFDNTRGGKQTIEQVQLGS